MTGAREACTLVYMLPITDLTEYRRKRLSTIDAVRQTEVPQPEPVDFIPQFVILKGGGRGIVLEYYSDFYVFFCLDSFEIDRISSLEILKFGPLVEVPEF